MQDELRIEDVSAVTLVVSDLARAMAFYESLGFERGYGTPDGTFASYKMRSTFLNLQRGEAGDPRSWGRVIIYVSDVDAMWRRVVEAGGAPAAKPADAMWGERYFHLRDPDGHELSFARPLTDDGPDVVLQVGVKIEDTTIMHAMNEAEVPAVGSLDGASWRGLLDLADRVVVAKRGDVILGFSVLMRDGSTYGSANYRWFADRLERFVYVDRVVVGPGARGEGLGRLLYDHTIAWAEDRPVTAEVNTIPPNDVSLAFHEQFGFVEVGRQSNADGKKEVVMLQRDGTAPQ